MSETGEINASVGRLHQRMDELVASMGDQHKMLASTMADLARDVAVTRQASEQTQATSKENKRAIGKLSDQVRDLELEAAKQDGQKGVLAAIIRSPAIAWLMAGGAALWAALKGYGGAGQ